MSHSAIHTVRSFLIACTGFAVLSCKSSDSTGPGEQAIAATFVRISSGADFSCGLTEDGTAYCWGSNDKGQLGDGTNETRLKPAKVSTTAKFTVIASGANHTCALHENDGVPYCWGKNQYGQSGAGVIGTNQLVPAMVVGGYRFVSIAPSDHSTCATTSGRDVYCWGLIQDMGYMGDAVHGTPTLEPKQIGGGMVAVVAGYNAPNGPTYCSVDDAGLAYCWILMYTYPPAGAILPPIKGPVSTTLNFTTLRVGSGHVCGIVSSGDTYCWGANNLGQLGDGTTSYSADPVLVGGGLKFESLAVGGGNVIIDDGAGISANSGFSCGIVAGGKAYCWGANNRSQLGIANSVNFVSAPQPVAGGLSFTGLRAGGYHVCGLDVNKTAYCWGDNNAGQLGDGTLTPASTPTHVIE